MNEEVQADPVTKVARDLTEIVNMTASLDDQAEHKHSARIDGTVMPGGLAMVALANVANHEAWENMQQATERYGRDYTSAEDEDDEWEPPLQTLCFWSEQWRVEHGAEYGQRPTVASEANFLRYLLSWAWDNELRWDDFAADIRKTKKRLEDLLVEGERARRGVPCMYDECKGRRLIQKLEPYSENGEKMWRLSDWHCTNCHRKWGASQYLSMVAAAAWNAQSEEIDGEVWCTPKYAARQVDRPEVTVRAWLSKGELPSVCIIQGRRTGFVPLAVVQAKDEKSPRRRKRAA